MSDNPSDRLLAQRVRNRIMEELSTLAGGADLLQFLGWEYVEEFLSLFPEAPKLNPATKIMLSSEREAVSNVLRIALSFVDELRGATEEQLIRAGRVEPLASAARSALALLNERGRFDEEIEEEEPSAGKQPD